MGNIMKKLFLLAIIAVFFVGCGPTKLSMLNTKPGEAATAYQGKQDEMMADLRLLLSGGDIPPYKVEEGVKKGYISTGSGPWTTAVMLVPVRGMAANGVEVNAYALEVTVTSPGGNPTGFVADNYYTRFKRTFESKYPVVRVK